MPGKLKKPEDGGQAGRTRLDAHLETGIRLWSELARAPVPALLEQKTGLLLGLCQLLRYRFQTGCDLPLIGILGSASSGKSTLLNSIAGAEVSRVTPIPHQTAGPIVAAPRGFHGNAQAPGFLRPVVSGVEWVAQAGSGLVGSPQNAVVVPAWDEDDKPFLLIDLPDIGTVDSADERLVALRLLPWLDRIILLATEESFAQAEHEQIEQWLRALRPERARAEVYVVLNRRHRRTTDAGFASRLAKVRSIWTNAVVSTLPHLEDGEMFPAAATGPLTSESHARAVRILHQACCNLSLDLSAEVVALAETRKREQEVLSSALEREIRDAARLRKAFLSEEFRKRLEVFSPWRTSMRRLRSLIGSAPPDPRPVVALLSCEHVHRHFLRTSEQLWRRLHTFARLAPGGTQSPASGQPPSMEERFRKEIDDLIHRTNEKAAQDVEDLLTTLQEKRTVKDPLWSAAAGLASTLFLLDLVVPSVGTLGTLAASGAASVLGLGGMVMSDVLRKLRTSRLRGFFENGFEAVLRDASNRLYEASDVARLDISMLAGRLAQWSRELPKV